MIKHKNITYAVLLGSLTAFSAHAAPAPLTAQKTVVVPGGPAHFDWMLVDAPRHRLYATHPGKGTLVVYDLNTKAVRQIATDGEVNGEAVDEADGKLFVAGGNQKVVVLDLKTLAKTGEVALTGPADAIAFDPKNGTLYVDHDDGAEVWTVDAKTDKVTGSVPIAGAPEFIAYNAVTDRLYQNIKPANCTQVINPSTNTVEATWPSAPMTSPHGLAIDDRTGRVFAAGSGKAVMMDRTTGKVLASVNIAPGYVDQIAFDASSSRLYCASSPKGGPSQVSVVQESATGMTLLGSVPVPPGTHTLAVDPQTHHVWVSSAGDKDSLLTEMVPS